MGPSERAIEVHIHPCLWLENFVYLAIVAVVILLPQYLWASICQSQYYSEEKGYIEIIKFSLNLTCRYAGPEACCPSPCDSS